MPTHGELLSDGLRQLQLQQEQQESSEAVSPKSVDHPPLPEDIHNGELIPSQDTDSQLPSSIHPPWPHVREGYGFRTPSGTSTPQTLVSHGERTSPLPDPHGLGWPGMPCPLHSLDLAYPFRQPSPRSRVCTPPPQSVMPGRKK